MTAQVIKFPNAIALADQAIAQIRLSECEAEAQVLLGMFAEENGVSEEWLKAAVKARLKERALQIIGINK